MLKQIGLAVAPRAMVAREVARAQYEAISSAKAVTTSAQSGNVSETRWRGASRALRSMVSWIPKLGSGRSDLPLRERKTLIARSQDAYRNHLLGRAAVNRARTNIVGTGLIPHATVDAQTLGISDDEAEALDNVIDSEWATWAEDAAECDAARSLDFYMQQELGLVSSMLAGDAWALTPFNELRGRRWGLKVQLIDAARVSNPQGAQNTERLIDGVVLDELGGAVHAWIQSRHPDDRTMGAAIDGWNRYDVFDAQGRRRLLQIWNEKERIDQVRGAPFLAPILEPLQKLEQFSRAELAAAVVGAMMTVFITKKRELIDGHGVPQPTFADGTQEGEGQQKIGETQQAQVRLGEGAIIDLAEGEEPKEVNPARPNARFDPFFLSVVKQIGAALEIPLDELLLHYSSSYSAARAAMLQAWRWYEMRRWWLVQEFCAPIRALWFDEAVARGRIPVTGYADPRRRAAYQACMWIGPARGAMDEDKEAKAAKARIDAKLSNETIETAALMGESWRQVQATRQRELRHSRRAEPPNAEQYAAAVRAGAITPQIDDEVHLREHSNLPVLSADTRANWAAPARRPVTLQNPERNRQGGGGQQQGNDDAGNGNDD